MESMQNNQEKQPQGGSDSEKDAEIQSLREELEEANEGKEHFETQYKNLLGRVNTIKTSLGDRLKADAVGSRALDILYVVRFLTAVLTPRRLGLKSSKPKSQTWKTKFVNCRRTTPL